MNPITTVTKEEKAKNDLQAFQRNKRQDIKSYPQIKHDYKFQRIMKDVEDMAKLDKFDRVIDYQNFDPSTLSLE